MLTLIKRLHSVYKKEIIFAIFLLSLYLITRLISLTNIPIFTDEAIYLRWAQIASGDANWRLISLTDGKQPLFIWLAAISMRIISDPLIAGRLVSVGSGLFGVVGMLFLGYEVSKKRQVGIIAASIYIVSPFFLVYDRLALMDGLLAVIGIWSLWLSLLLVKTLRLDVALILGLVVGVGFWTKSSAQFFLLFLSAMIIIFDFKKPHLVKRLATFLGLTLIIIILSQGMYNILRLSPFFHMIAQKDHTFILTFPEFIKNPTIYAFGNANGLTIWLGEYVTWPVLGLILISLVWYLKKNFRLCLLLLFWFLFPFISLSFFGKVIYPRYLLFMIIPLLVILALFINSLTKKKILLTAVILLFLPQIWFDFLLLTNPIKAPLTKTDSDQLLNEWPAGYGVAEVIEIVKQKSQEKKIFLATEGTFGLFPAAFELYLHDNKNIRMQGYWPVNEVPQELLENAKRYDTFLVFKEREEVPPEWPLKLIAKFPRGIGKTHLQMYQVLAK